MSLTSVFPKIQCDWRGAGDTWEDCTVYRQGYSAAHVAFRTDHSNRVLGRAIAQAVSRWLPTAAARVRSRVWSSGICGGQSGAGAGFLRVLWFPLPIFIPPNSPSS
jgi:hypothetical protein